MALRTLPQRLAPIPSKLDAAPAPERAGTAAPKKSTGWVKSAGNLEQLLGTLRASTAYQELQLASASEGLDRLSSSPNKDTKALLSALETIASSSISSTQKADLVTFSLMLVEAWPAGTKLPAKLTQLLERAPSMTDKGRMALRFALANAGEGRGPGTPHMPVQQAWDLWMKDNSTSRTMAAQR